VAYSLKIANTTDYVGAGTVEYLMDIDTGEFYLINVNPRRAIHILRLSLLIAGFCGTP